MKGVGVFIELSYESKVYFLELLDLMEIAFRHPTKVIIEGLRINGNIMFQSNDTTADWAREISNDDLST